MKPPISRRLSPGICFQPLMVGQGSIRSAESRGVASDNLSIRSVVRIALEENASDHSTISRTRRLIDTSFHDALLGHGNLL
ncbi:MAG TPA: hypothetical protein VFW94_22370 [Candidatus Acidoferrales bacterium]|nr:hypothetical protein [Candidatus Acidoferrales bacterium]